MVAVRSKAKNSHNEKYSVTRGTDADSKGSKSSGSALECTNQLDMDISGMWEGRLDAGEEYLKVFSLQPSEPSSVVVFREPSSADRK